MTVEAQATAELEAIIARTALRYDLLPYESKPFPVSQPTRLGGQARLFGLEAAPMENARVLELGCASGGNLIPHAALWPNAKFVGVDLARMQVAAGRARIERLGLKNVEILCQSFTEIGEELGKFDYIVCHGVYSWVPPQVQDAILRVIRARLSPVGVASVSFNVLPGWRMMQPVRDAMLLATPDGVDVSGRVAMAREVLSFLADASPDKGPYGETLRQWSQRLGDLPGDYIAHEFLEECNNPCLVRDFAMAANRHGLGYLGECELSSMILENHGQKVAEGVRARAGNDMVASEQWLDLLTGRTFRQSLLVASDRMADVRRNLNPEAIAALHFVLPNGLKLNREGDGAVLSAPDGRALNTHMPIVVAMLEKMAARHPASSCLDDLLSPEDGPDARAAMLDALYRITIAGLAHLSSEPVRCAAAAGEAPRAGLVARDDARAGAAIATNLRHEIVNLDHSARIILPLLDGRTKAAALEAALLDAASGGRLTFSRDGEPVTDEKALKSIVAEHLPTLLAGIAATGLLEP